MFGAGSETGTERLWDRYKKHRDAGAREVLIMRHVHLVKYAAGRLAVNLPSHVDFDDLVGWGALGLIDAVEKFDPSRGVKFETYALSRIKGAMVDGLRALDWVPHSVRRKARQIEQVCAELEGKLGRAATDEELAEALGIEPEKLPKLLGEVSCAALLSLEEAQSTSANDEAGLPLHELVGDPDEGGDPVLTAELEEAKRILADAVDRLPEKERTVVALYYYEGLTAKEIAVVLGLSESRISQLHTKAILRLRGRLSRAKKALVGPT